MSKTLIEQLDEFVAAWKQRVPADRRAAIVSPDQNGAILDVSAPLRNGPVVATFYRDGFEGLPLGQAHLMSFELIPLAPLNPLRQLQGMNAGAP